MSKTHWYAPFKGTFPVLDADPDEGPFFCVSFNVQYAPFIRGALFALLQRQMWTGSDADRRLMRMRVQQLLFMFGQLTDCPSDSLPEEYEVMASLCENLRIHNGRLQALCCGEWTDVDGQTGSFEGGQPGEGSEQPGEGGGQACYHINRPANMQALLPTTVSQGDTIECTNLTGAATDGSTVPFPARWDCPDGKYFALGTCQDGTEGTSGSDPLPSAPHMSLIMQIAGTWYSCLDPLTVPSGVHDEQVTFQLNDDALGDNSGQYGFDVCVTNNSIGRFTHHFNLKAAPSGWIANQLGGSNNTEWQAGIGFHCSTTASVTSNGDNIIDFPSAALLEDVVVEVKWSNTTGADTSNATKGYSTTTVTGSPTDNDVYSAHGIVDHVSNFANDAKAMRVVVGSGATEGDESVITDIFVSANGADPF